MPAAHIMVQSVGSMHSLLQQSQYQQALGNGLAQYQQNAALNDQLAMQNCYGALWGQQPISDEARRAANIGWAMSRARAAAGAGNTLIARMSFWSAFGLFALPILNRLAAKLDRVTDDVERYIGMAA